MRLLVFLGNPGKEYGKTRHNVGWRVADTFFATVSWQKKFHGLFAQEPEMRLLKPQTFMNLSGISVSEASSFYHLKPEEIVVVHDDLELPMGKIKLQMGGGLQGHNGLRSIKEMIGSDRFCRMRIGIGRPKYGNVAQYVLSPFTQDEEIALSLLMGHIKQMLDRCDCMPQEYSLGN